MINVHILELADTTACYNGTIKHIFELATELQERCRLHVLILEDGFDSHFQSYMYQYLKMLQLDAQRRDKGCSIELIDSIYMNGMPDGWLVGKRGDHGVCPTHMTFESMLHDSREYLQVFIVPWRTITGEVFQKIAERMYEENIHADIIVPVTKASTIITTNPLLYTVRYDYRHITAFKRYGEEEYDRRKFAGDPYWVGKTIHSDMLKHYIRPKGIESAPELSYLYNALYAEEAVDYEPCDTEESMSRMRKEDVEQ